MNSAPLLNEFGSDVFGPLAQKAVLDGATLSRLAHSAETGEPLDGDTAEAVAQALFAWAVKRGATHYAHVFYPLNGQTAEKHESLFAPGPDGTLVPAFNAKCLASGESDGSSFPSGGLRTTFEARGVTAWDVRCPPYLVRRIGGEGGEVVLAIPSRFTSATGDSLDEKTPLARAGRALSTQAERVLSLLGVHEGPVHANAGVEQEYFLVDRAFYRDRPDLAICGRTLFGARPPKGQEFADQYFGAIPERVKAYMLDFEHELFRLGIVAQTRHNEVAPAQYEFVSYFERDYLASDHQHMVMQVMQRVAERHGFACLLHEKPFAGVNGSGKHVNWSLHTAKRNLCKGGAHPEENVPFLVFSACVLRAVHKYAPLLRAMVAGGGNDHRLGANEAPPAILSVFLGESLVGVFERLVTGEAVATRGAGDDRNRTSPFAYTGNKFEFRAVGASQPVSTPLMALNAAVAEALSAAADRLESILPKRAGAAARERAGRQVAAEFYREHSAIVFNGDGYSEAWRSEARRRGLPEISNSVDAYLGLCSQENLALLASHCILSEREVRSRAEIYLDRYVKQISTESSVCLSMAECQVLPAAHRHVAELAETANAQKAALGSTHTARLRKATARVRALEDAIDALRKAVERRRAPLSLERQALHCRDAVLPAMAAVREAADAVETSVPADLWPLPTYRELLFVR